MLLLLLLLLLSLLLSLFLVVGTAVEILLPSPLLPELGASGGLPPLPAGLPNPGSFPTDAAAGGREASAVVDDGGWGGGTGGCCPGLLIPTLVSSSLPRAATLSFRFTACSSSALSFLRRSMTSHTPGVTPAGVGVEATFFLVRGGSRRFGPCGERGWAAERQAFAVLPATISPESARVYCV